METAIRFFHDSGQSYFLFGPRGTGKSTWLKGKYPDALYIDLLIPEVFQRYAAQPSRLRDVITAYPQKNSIVIIDEIQKLPDLLSLVHALMEEYKDKQFILTGSSARKLKRHGVDLLAGRALLKTFHPFIAAEMGSYFSIESALVQGMVPLVVNAQNPEKTLAGYTALYIQEEVKAEGITRNVEWFARFLEALSFSHGSVLNLNAVSRECAVKSKTVSNYLGIVEDLLLGWLVPVFEKRAQRALAAHPKFYFFDCGVFRSLRPSGPLDRPYEIDGAALEGFVAQHLKAWIALSENGCKLYYWRTKGGTEVDFVIYGSEEFMAIEVKNAARIRPEDVRGLREFAKDFPEARTIALYRGSERIMCHGVLCMPCDDFLKGIKPGLPLPL
jgi:uncharacterized protein